MSETNIPTIDEVYASVKEKLSELEQFRLKTHAYNNKALIRIIIAFLVGVLASIGSYFINPPVGIAVIVISLAAVIYFITRYDFAGRKKVKQEFIETVVKCFDSDLTYQANEHISENVILDSGIIKFLSTDHVSGDNYVRGLFEGHAVQFSEIKIIRKAKGKNDSDRTIFRGVYLIADFNKSFTTRTVVLEDTMEKYLGFLGQRLQNTFSFGKLVKLENPEFEKHFAVYADDQVEARYLLSMSMMEKLVELYKDTHNTGVACGFINGRFHMALRGDDGMASFSLSKSVLSKSTVTEHYLPLKRLLSIIETLELNQKLWSKQN